jgi:hypothetical protein
MGGNWEINQAESIKQTIKNRQKYSKNLKHNPKPSKKHATWE